MVIIMRRPCRQDGREEMGGIYARPCHRKGELGGVVVIAQSVATWSWWRRDTVGRRAGAMCTLSLVQTLQTLPLLSCRHRVRALWLCHCRMGVLLCIGMIMQICYLDHR